MKARRSRLAQQLFQDNVKARKFLKQIKENDKLDGKPIKTIFGYARKL